MGIDVERTTTGTSGYDSPLQTGSSGFDAGGAFVETSTPTSSVSVGVPPYSAGTSGTAGYMYEPWNEGSGWTGGSTGPSDEVSSRPDVLTVAGSVFSDRLPPASGLTVIFQGETITITDPFLIRQLQDAAERGNWAMVTGLLAPLFQGAEGMEGNVNLQNPNFFGSFVGGGADNRYHAEQGDYAAIFRGEDGQDQVLALNFDYSAGPAQTVEPGVLSVEHHDVLQRGQVFTLVQSLLTASGGQIPSDWTAADFVAYVFGFAGLGGLTETPEWATFAAQFSKPGALSDPGSLDYSMFSAYFPDGDASILSTLVSQGTLLHGVFTALGAVNATELNDATFATAYSTAEEGHVSPEHGRHLSSEAVLKAVASGLPEYGSTTVAGEGTAAGFGEAAASGAGGGLVGVGVAIIGHALFNEIKAGFEAPHAPGTIEYKPTQEGSAGSEPTFGRQYQEGTAEAFIAHINDLLADGTSEALAGAVDLLYLAGYTLQDPAQLEYVLDSLPSGARTNLLQDIKANVTAESGGATNYFEIVQNGHAYSRLEDIAFGGTGRSEERSGLLDGFVDTAPIGATPQYLADRLASVPPEVASEVVSQWTARAEDLSTSADFGQIVDTLAALQAKNPESFEALITTMNGSGPANLQNLLAMLIEIGGPAENALAGRILEALPVAQRAELLSDLTGIPVKDLITNLNNVGSTDVYEYTRNLSPEALAETKQYLTDFNAAATAAGNDYGFAQLTTPGARAIYLENLTKTNSAEDPAILLATLTPEDAAAVLVLMTPETVGKLLSALPPEKAAAILDVVPPQYFEQMVAVMDLEAAVAMQPHLAANATVLSDAEVKEYANRLAPLVGVDASVIEGMLNGTTTLEELQANGGFVVIPVLFDLLQAGNTDAIAIVDQLVQKLVDLGAGGIWSADQLAVLEDLRNATTGVTTGDQEHRDLGGAQIDPNSLSVEALGTLFGLLTSAVGGVNDALNEIAMLRTVPPALEALDINDIAEQNPVVAEILNDPAAAERKYLTEIAGTEEGRALLASEGFQVIDGELYYLPDYAPGPNRQLQTNPPTDNPTGTPSAYPTVYPSANPTNGPSLFPSVQPSNSQAPTGSSSPTSGPTLVTPQDKVRFFQKYGRFDVAIEFNLDSGPGATGRQYRGFFATSFEYAPNGELKFNLRFRELVLVGPEQNIYQNWVNVLDIPELLRGGDITRPHRPAIFNVDGGMTQVRDIRANFEGDRLASTKYQSSVGFIAEGANGQNAFPHQFINGVTRAYRFFTGQGPIPPGEELVPYHRAVANYEAAETEWRSANVNYGRVIANNDVLNDSVNTFNDATLDFQQSLATYTTAVVQPAADFNSAITDLGTSIPQAGPLRDAFDTLDGAVAEYNDALLEYSTLLDQWSAQANINPSDPQTANLEARLDAAERRLNAAEAGVTTALSSLTSIAGTSLDTESDVLSTITDAFGLLTEVVDTISTAEGAYVSAVATHTRVLIDVSAVNHDVAAALERYSDAADFFQRASAQLHNAEPYTQGNAWLQTLKSVFRGRYFDGEAGAGAATGSVYTFSTYSPDPSGGSNYDYNPHAVWQAGLDVVVPIGGGVAFNWAVGAIVHKYVSKFYPGAEGQQPDRRNYVQVGTRMLTSGIAADAETRTFLEQLFQPTIGPDGESNRQGLYLVGNMTTSLVYSMFANEYFDGVSPQLDGFGWVAFKPRKQNPFESPFPGTTLGKWGGRIQVNLNYDFTPLVPNFGEKDNF